MDMTKMPLFAALQRKMEWLNQRQQVLAQNIANADTPGYKPSDLVPVRFDDLLGQTTAGGSPKLEPVATDPMHISGAEADAKPRVVTQSGKFEASPTGNAVNLEQEMVKLAQTQIDFAATTSLYKKQVGLLKLAIGQR